MKRKIEQELLAWKSSERRKPLILNGARQVGKTYSLLAFAKGHYSSVLYVDFSAQKNACALFDGDITPGVLLPQLEVLTGVRVVAGKTLIFFDEIQACPRALTSLKYFQERAAEQHVIAAGSLLGVALGREEYSFPVGKVDTLSMHPLDFEEYLWAQEEDQLAQLIRSSFEKNTPFGLHDYALGCYRKYLLVGGMPEAVLASVANASFDSIQSIQQNIIDAYVADMTKYASPLDSAKILNVWRSVPEQLAKENHKFQYATIASSARAFQYEAPINWLHSAGLVSFCYRVGEGCRPLRSFVERDFFKLYLVDVGLLSVLQGATREDVESALGKSARFRGGLAENYVMQQLVSLGREPFYWGISSKSEVDFVIQEKSGEVVPLEVKSGENVSARSLEAYRKAYKPPYVIRVSAKQFGYSCGVKSVPLYAVFCLD